MSSRDDVKAAFFSLKSKASNYLNTVATKNANSSYGREISRLISAGSVASTNGPPGTNLIPADTLIPSDDEVLMVYPSYSRQTSDGWFEVEVRGWLYLPGQPNRKSRMVIATAKKVAGVRNDVSNGRYDDKIKEEKILDMIEGEYKNESTSDLSRSSERFMFSRAHSFGSSTTSSSVNSYTQEETLKARLAPFFTRPVAFRTINITFSGLTDESGCAMQTFTTETNTSGRFSTRIKLHKQPTIVSVQAHDNLVSFEEVINVGPFGISVISDIDDTIKNTGILGNKRELFRNVFVHDYEKIAIEGVQRWYTKLQAHGVQFHYVSNSPWQLYPTISEYLRNSNFPRGSMHLKEYSGFLNGLFEPAHEKKRMNLNKILNDFPNRKFILVGDSGEGDLEAYIDIARRFPSQVLAIYIRDVTLPPGDETLLSEFQIFRTKPAPHNLQQEQGKPVSLLDLPLDAVRPTPPKPRNFSTPILSISQTPPVATTSSRRVPPPIPPKPSQYKLNKKPDAPPLPPRPGVSTQDATSAPPPYQSQTSISSQHSSTSTNNLPPPPPLPRRHAQAQHPVIQPSSQDGYEFNDILDKRIENWKARFLSARKELPENVHLHMWRVGKDVEEESLEVLSRAKNAPFLG
jgi:phosphatidate phosphatase APP1